MFAGPFMGRLRLKLDEARENVRTATKTKPPRFAPAGQSTQMIIGADAASDKTILDTSANLYGSYRLKRVYYSAFSPIPDASRALPLVAPPLLREHRLYQADWLMRFYGFDAGEIVDEAAGMYLTSEAIRFLMKDKENDLNKEEVATLNAYKGGLDSATKFIPTWVKVAVAIALGLGTMSTERLTQLSCSHDRDKL